MCLIFNTVLNHFKASNLKRHNDTNHKHFHGDYLPDSEIRSHKIKLLKSSPQCQMTTLIALCKEADVTTCQGRLLYVIAWNIAMLYLGILPDLNVLTLMVSLLKKIFYKLHLYSTQLTKRCNILFPRWHCQGKLLYVE